MSHAASHYVKHLVTAPNGERITAPEKAVLGQLADDHREEVGVAWPSVGSLAHRACLSERQCRRVLAEVERKGVIMRLPTARERDGGQSSNEYVFVQLDPVARMDSKTLEENRRKLQKTPRSRMTGGGGHVRPTPPVMDDLPPRTSATGAPGHVRPPIDSSRDSSNELLLILPAEEIHPLPPPQADGVLKTKTPASRPLKGLGALLISPEATRRAAAAVFTGVMDELMDYLLQTRPTRGVAASGPCDWDRFCFNELAVASCQVENGQRMLFLSSPDPPATVEGLRKYKPTWDRLLRKWFKAAVEIRVVAREARRMG